MNDLKNKRFDLIILKKSTKNEYVFLTFKGSKAISELQSSYYDNQRYTTEMVEAIANNYHISNYIGNYYVYQPN